MVLRKQMTNTEIYNTATVLIELFQSMAEGNQQFPVKINFYFQKNMNVLVEMAQELEKERIAILTKFQDKESANEDSEQITIAPEHIEEANQELQDLFALTQEVKVNTIDLDAFDGVSMTPQQVQAISFMINDNEE